jgi:hypothetical protein
LETGPGKYSSVMVEVWLALMHTRSGWHFWIDFMRHTLEAADSTSSTNFRLFLDFRCGYFYFSSLRVFFLDTAPWVAAGRLLSWLEG